jgi:hypothetical protein
MLFGRQIILFLFYFFLPCHALQCTTNCSYTYNLTEPFNIPDRCNQIVSAGKCVAYLRFSYDTQTYNVQFLVSSSIYVSGADNTRSAYLNLVSTTSPDLQYKISYECKNKDDCARDLARNGANDMLQRRLQFREIVNEVTPLILSPSNASNNYNLICYDSNDNEFQCGTSAKPALCIISDIFHQNAMNRSCAVPMQPNEVFVSMYQSESNYGTFDVQCNRSLCNVIQTLQAVKNVMFKYNVTITSDGRLMENGSMINYGSKLMICVLFVIIKFLGLLPN